MSGLVPEIEKRRARRALSEKPVPDDVIDRIMTAATFAPSCFNNQSWRFIVVREPESLAVVKSHLSKGNAWGTPSPCMVLVATNADLDCRLEGGRDYALFDTGMAVMNLQIQATKEGLYAHPIAGFRAVDLRAAMGIPEDYVLVTVVIMGYPGGEDFLDEKQKEGEHGERQRKPVAEVVCRDTWKFPG